MPWRNRIGRARGGAPDVTRSTSRPAISIGIPRDSSRPAGRGQAARIASRSRPGAARWLGPDEEDDREDVQERSEEHTSELQSLAYLVCRLLLEKKKTKNFPSTRFGSATKIISPPRILG